MTINSHHCTPTSRPPDDLYQLPQPATPPQNSPLPANRLRNGLQTDYWRMCCHWSCWAPVKRKLMTGQMLRRQVVLDLSVAMGAFATLCTSSQLFAAARKLCSMCAQCGEAWLTVNCRSWCDRWLRLVVRYVLSDPWSSQHTMYLKTRGSILTFCRLPRPRRPSPRRFLPEARGRACRSPGPEISDYTSRNKISYVPRMRGCIEGCSSWDQVYHRRGGSPESIPYRNQPSQTPFTCPVLLQPCFHSRFLSQTPHDFSYPANRGL